jgi:hypothetical protein
MKERYGPHVKLVVPVVRPQRESFAPAIDTFIEVFQIQEGIADYFMPFAPARIDTGKPGKQPVSYGGNAFTPRESVYQHTALTGGFYN